MRLGRSRTSWLSRLFKFVALTGCILIYVPTEAGSPLNKERIVGGLRLYFSPRDNLPAIDYGILGTAKFRIDLAAYVLSDRGIMDSLLAAAKRGVKIRIYLDPDQPSVRRARMPEAFSALLSTPGIQVRVKNGGRDLMHLKAYQVDGRILRTGATNFSYSGMRRQDNDLLIIESPGLAAEFISRFNELWNRPGSEPLKSDL